MLILDLPPELFIQILANLDHKDVLRCCSVCKIFSLAIRNSQKLQYKIELAYDGMIDMAGSGSEMSTGDKLQLLLDRRNAWKTLEWKHKLQVPMSGSCRAYELVSGVFAKSTAVSSALGSRHFVLARLPSRRGRGAEIIREDVGVASRDFVIDPTQDLIGYVSEHGVFPHSEIQIHLRTISTDKPHPDAQEPIIHHTCTLPFVMTNSFVAVAQDVIAIFFWVDSPGLIIWNWHTSNMLVYVTDYGRLPPGIWDFSLLSNRAFILTSRAGNGSIEIYSFDDTPVTSALNHVASLQLPPVQTGIQLALFSTHSGPFTTTPNRKHKHKLMGEDKPFTSAPESRVHAMCVQYHLGGVGLLERRSRFFFFIKNQCFMRFVEAYKREFGSRQDNEGEEDYQPFEATPAKNVPWEEWGPDNSRFMAYGMHFRWLRYVHGQKVVCPLFTIFQEKACVLEVLDFNVHVNRLPDQIGVGEGGKPLANTKSVFTVHTEPLVVPKAEIFTEDVVTRLPYTSAMRRDMGDGYSGFMIDEERLVGLRSNSSPDGEMGDIDVFTF